MKTYIKVLFFLVLILLIFIDRFVPSIDLVGKLSSAINIAGRTALRSEPHPALSSMPALVPTSVSGSTSQSNLASDALSTATLSAGCGKPGQSTGTLDLSTSDGAGVLRRYRVQVPRTYDPSTPLAMTLVFHGASGDPATSAAFGIQNAPGAGDASIFVFPQGIQFQHFGVGWDDSCHGYDMIFFDHIVSNLERNYCIDKKKIFVAGFSWGGDFVTALLCCRGDRIRGAAVASSTDEYTSAADYLTYYNLTNRSCPVVNNAAIRFTHATDGDGAYPAPLFATTSQLFRMFNTCSSKSTAATPTPCLSFDGCRQSYLECSYPGLGHSTPANWNVDTWNFFADLR